MRSPASARSITLSSVSSPAGEPSGNENCVQPRSLLGKSLGKPATGRTGAASPKGVAFSIAELLLVQAWAEANDIGMRIYLDHGSSSEEYEEAISIEPECGPVGRALIWRNDASVFVQPLLGRRRRYVSISAAIESLVAEERVSVTDIVATSWPKD